MRRELTSRIAPRDVSLLLRQMERPLGADDALDVLLCTNMISVGVDIGRFGLMLVTGQPKTSAEYIQATSRVGRQVPGLVVTLYNWSRPRDLSHYERFRSYHSMLYRHVEVTSVTPWSSRARDKGLHAVFVGLVRLLDPRLATNVGARAFDPSDPLVAGSAMPRCARTGYRPRRSRRGTEELQALIDGWALLVRSYPTSLTYRRPPNAPDHPITWLLESAEDTGVAEDFPRGTLNSLREVEGPPGFIQSRFTGPVPEVDVDPPAASPKPVITTFGPGAILDLPDDAVMLAGIEHWFPGGLGSRNSRTLFEPRLQAMLHVQSFRTPPVGSPGERDLPFVRFPLWRVCPACSRLSDSHVLPRKRPGHRASHAAMPVAGRHIPLGSSLLVNGVISRISLGRAGPWPRPSLRNTGAHPAGVGGRPQLGISKSFRLWAVTFAGWCAGWRLRGALLRSCPGRRPWLDAGQESCQESPEALQRGASNVYFSVTRSALSIPPWTDPLQRAVAAFWSGFATPLPPEIVDRVLRSRFPHEDPARVRACLDRIEQLQGQRQGLRAAEYDVLNAPADLNEPRSRHSGRQSVRTLAKS